LGPDVGNGLITESPLDYHVFRQEIVSEYPAYHPPKPILSFELARDPVLRSFTINSTTGRTASGGNEYLVFGRKGGGTNSGSILKNAVHTVTPAPSPPQSPRSVGGKRRKKQNYQKKQ